MGKGAAKKVANKKKKSNLGKVLVGAGVLAATGAAAYAASDKRTRKKLEVKAKKTVKQLKTNPKVKEIGAETGDFLTKAGEFLKNFFK